MIQKTFSMKAGLKIFGPEGEKAVSNELTQHYDMEINKQVDPKTLTYKQRREALLSLMFLISSFEKRDGLVKSRMCTDGSKQRLQEGYKKEDVASPMWYIPTGLYLPV